MALYKRIQSQGKYDIIRIRFISRCIIAVYSGLNFYLLIFYGNSMHATAAGPCLFSDVLTTLHRLDSWNDHETIKRHHCFFSFSSWKSSCRPRCRAIQRGRGLNNKWSLLSRLSRHTYSYSYSNLCFHFIFHYVFIQSGYPGN